MFAMNVPKNIFPGEAATAPYCWIGGRILSYSNC